MYPKKIIISAVLAAAVLGGCASDHSDRLFETKQSMLKALSGEQIVRQYQEKQKEEKKIHINARNQWVYSLIKKVAKSERIPVDRSFIPSTEYRVSAKGAYSLGEFLDMVHKQTGVNYVISDGYLKVKNQSFVNAYFPNNLGCGAKGAKRFTLSLKNAPLSRIFGYFIEKKGYTVQYDLHNHSSIDELPPISFSYRGCSVRDALQRIAKATDLKIVYKKGKILEVRDYDTLKSDVPNYYDLSFTSSSNALGESKGGTGTRLSDKMSSNEEFKSILSTFMSNSGKAYVSGRGYLIIEDKPSYIARIKKILNKEVGSQRDIDLDITIVSVELKDAYSSGVDWQKVLEPALNKYKFGVGVTDPIGTNAFTLSHLSSGGKLSMLQLLGEYGKTKVVKEHHLSTRSGTLSTLKAVDIIPYVTETSQITNGVSEIQKEAKSVESGIVMNIKPTMNGDDVNLNVDVTVSEYLGDKEFSDGFKLPQLKTNNIQAPLTVKLGDTTLLTGISLRDDINKYSGLPNMQNLGDASILTGKNEDSVSRKEYLIFIKPSRRRK